MLLSAPQVETLGYLTVGSIVMACAVSRGHPLKEFCKEVLWLVANNPGAFFTDAEVLQEMLHCYLALRPWPEGKQIIPDFAALMSNRAQATGVDDVERACELTDRCTNSSGLTARNALRVATMIRKQGLRRVFQRG